MSMWKKQTTFIINGVIYDLKNSELVCKDYDRELYQSPSGAFFLYYPGWIVFNARMSEVTKECAFDIAMAALSNDVTNARQIATNFFNKELVTA